MDLKREHAGKRIKEALKLRDMSASELANKVGVGKTSISGYTNLKYEPTSETLVKMAEALNVNSAWLAGFDVQMLNDKTPKRSGEISVPFATKRSSETDSLILSGEYVSYPSRFIDGLSPAGLYALEVQGDSMRGLLLEAGDVAIFSREEPSGDGVYIVSINGALFVRRVEFDYLSQELVLKTENSRSEAQRVSLNTKKVTLEGKVVGWIHKHLR